MVDLIDAIKKRRSVRKYTSQSVSTEAIRRILSAALWAPSAHNAQPWKFIVLSDKESKNNLSNVMGAIWLRELEKDGVPRLTREATVKASANRFSFAPILIIACITLENMDSYPDEKRKQIERELAIQSLAAAVQNLLLAAYAEKLGSCWHCAPIFCKDAVREALNIPKEIEPQALITIGHPVEQPQPPQRKSLEAVAFAEQWGKPF